VAIPQALAVLIRLGIDIFFSIQVVDGFWRAVLKLALRRCTSSVVTALTSSCPATTRRSSNSTTFQQQHDVDIDEWRSWVRIAESPD
jgi:hypothetical protein